MTVLTPGAPQPDTPSSDHKEMSEYWQRVEDILGGIQAMRKSTLDHLPAFPHEAKDNPDGYERRKANSCMTNVFGDIVSNLALKPFERPVKIRKEMSRELQDFSKDVNGRGESLHVFCSKAFYKGITDGLGGVLIDFTRNVPENITRAQEQEIGARAYWMFYDARDILAVYSTFINGKEVIIHARLRETITERDGYGEKEIVQVRVFDMEPGSMPTWKVLRKKESETQSTTRVLAADEWEETEAGTLPIDRIPLVMIHFGDRHGSSWRIDPPLRDAADLQIELYQKETALKNVRILSAFPMLAVTGVVEVPEQMEIGPHVVLVGKVPGGSSGGQQTTYAYVEPAGTSLKFLREDIQDTIKELREQGRQPLTAQSGNLTVITASVAAQKGTTAIQAWINNLEISIDNMFVVTAKWMNLEDYTIAFEIHDDFEIGFQDADLPTIIELMDKYYISREAGLQEFKRRGTLSKEYDSDEDADKIDDEAEDREEEEENLPPVNDPAPEGDDPPEGA